RQAAKSCSGAMAALCLVSAAYIRVLGERPQRRDRGVFSFANAAVCGPSPMVARIGRAMARGRGETLALNAFPLADYPRGARILASPRRCNPDRAGFRPLLAPLLEQRHHKFAIHERLHRRLAK